jgi:hypothetical protein
MCGKHAKTYKQNEIISADCITESHIPELISAGIIEAVKEETVTITDLKPKKNEKV